MKMKMIGAMIILTLGLIITGCGKSNIDTANANTNNAKSNNTKSNNDNVKEAFEQAKIINENSHIDVELLGRPDESTGAASEGGLGDMVPPATYSEGGVTAYAFVYPSDGGGLYWTQVYVEDEEHDLLGIHVGEDISDIEKVMEEYGYHYSESTDRVYTSKDVDRMDIYTQGDVHFCYYMKGDTLVFMLVTVYEE